MGVVILAGGPVEVDEGGFLVDVDAWTPAIAESLALRSGIELTNRHWDVIEFCRRDFDLTGTSPTIRRITRRSDITTREIYSLFPTGPGILVAKISGLPKLRTCL
jgi:TusE/DsrC/DsvC family sulfur relay protein